MKIAFVLKTDKEKRRQRRGSEGIPRKQNLSLVAVGLHQDVNSSLQRFCSTPKASNQAGDCRGHNRKGVWWAEKQAERGWAAVKRPPLT